MTFDLIARRNGGLIFISIAAVASLIRIIILKLRFGYAPHQEVLNMLSAYPGPISIRTAVLVPPLRMIAISVIGGFSTWFYIERYKIVIFEWRFIIIQISLCIGFIIAVLCLCWLFSLMVSTSYRIILDENGLNVVHLLRLTSYEWQNIQSIKIAIVSRRRVYTQNISDVDRASLISFKTIHFDELQGSKLRSVTLSPWMFMRIDIRDAYKLINGWQMQATKHDELR